MNDAQKAVVNHEDGSMLVVAGAGTGKTNVIIERIAHLVASGVDKTEILALTFTEKAAQEMIDRAADRLQESYGIELNIHTFNGFGHAILQEFAVEIGMSSNLKLIGENGKVVLLKEHIDQLGLDYFAPISRPDGQLTDIADYFSKLKQQLIKPDEYTDYAAKLPAHDEEERLEAQRHQELAHAFKTYLEIMRNRNSIDYDDQLYLLIQLLELRPNVLKKLQARYRYIMVDEFQDTNPMQSRLIDLLAKSHHNVVAVGDDDQSIYGWRGATLANILEFNKRYPDLKEVTLIENFRSTQGILDAAWRLIQYNNPERLEAKNNLDKRLKAFRGEGITPDVHKFSRLDAELNWVAEDIKRRLDSGMNGGEIAVLARGKNSVSRVHQMLEASGVEHTVAGLSADLYEQPAVTMLLEALQAIADKDNGTALYHTLVSSLFACDPQIVAEAARKARKEHRSLVDLLADREDSTITKAIELISNWRKAAHELSAREVAYRIITDSGYKDSVYEQARDSIDVARSVQALGQWFATLQDFERVSLTPSTLAYLDNLDVLRAEGEILADDTVNISPTLPVVMTAHKAKGLEWSVVYIVDCTERSFPLQQRRSSLEVPKDLHISSDADDHYNEERRLMYVATTRAKDELIVTHSESHNGTTVRKPSRFIEELFGQTDGMLSTNEKLVGLDMLTTSTITATSVPLPASMRENENIVLTASQADDFMRCPLNFYYKHVLQVPEAPKAASEVGSQFHAIIQEINEAKMAGREAPKKSTFTEQLERQWPTIGYLSKTQRERAMKHGLKAFDTLYDRLLNEPVPVAVESPFRVHIPDSKLILRGRIDVIMPADAGIEIRDYKTSTTVHDVKRAKEKTTANVQLLMYALAWKISYDEIPEQVALDYVLTNQISPVKKQPKSLDTMANKLTKVAEDILAGNFEPGNKHENCLHPV